MISEDFFSTLKSKSESFGMSGFFSADVLFSSFSATARILVLNCSAISGEHSTFAPLLHAATYVPRYSVTSGYFTTRVSFERF